MGWQDAVYGAATSMADLVGQESLPQMVKVRGFPHEQTMFLDVFEQQLPAGAAA